MQLLTYGAVALAGIIAAPVLLLLTATLLGGSLDLADRIVRWWTGGARRTRLLNFEVW